MAGSQINAFFLPSPPSFFFFNTHLIHRNTRFSGREGQFEVRGNTTGGSLKVSNQSHPGRLPEGVSHQESVGLQLVLLKKQSSLYQAPRAVLEAGASVTGLGMRPRYGVHHRHGMPVCSRQHAGVL